LLESNPFNQRRQTATDVSKEQLDRKNTTGTLNRHDSQSQLTNFDALDSREVELKAQKDENSALFQDSLMQAQQPSRYYADAANQAAHLMHIPAINRRVTISLEEVLLEE
jgi:hypothetical protein